MEICCHNILLRRYGQPEMIDGQRVTVTIPDTSDAEKWVLENTEYHYCPTGKTMKGKDGIQYRHYIVMKGSSEYQTAEMSVLIDGVLGELHDMGIKILVPDGLYGS